MMALHARHVLDDPMVLKKIWLIMDGIFIWEFVTSLDYEWSVIRGHRPYRWTICVYSITRIAFLASVILNLIYIFNGTARLDCQAWVTFTWISSFLSLCMGSLLIAIRVVAVWLKNRVIVAIAIGIWVINASVAILGIARIRAIWVPLANTCSVTNLETTKPSVIALFITDALLLIIMLAGLLRLRDGGSLKLWRLLWKQGIIWFTISIAAELLELVFLVLDINVITDGLFLFPSTATLVIASTRLYRSLTDFSSPVDSAYNTPSCARSVSTSKRAPFVQVPSNRLEVTVHRTYEEHTNDHAPHPSSHVQLHDKPHEIKFDDNSTEDLAEK